MKKVTLNIGTAGITLCGHVIFVANESSVSVMLSDVEKFGSLFVPVNLLLPYDSKVKESSMEITEINDELNSIV
jgi:hypothetical protein